LFAKIEDEEIQKQIDKLEALKRLIPRKQKKVNHEKSIIQFEDFAKMDIQTTSCRKANKTILKVWN
jgi:methionyl-tRNA synthetase